MSLAVVVDVTRGGGEGGEGNGGEKKTKQGGEDSDRC